jgi:hypothetical protein
MFIKWTKVAWNAIDFKNSFKVSPLLVIYNLNRIFVATCFNRGKYQRAPSWTIVLKPWLKEFLDRCIMQFHMYIWSIGQRHNIYNYLDQVYEIQIFINPSRVLDQNFCM